MSTGPAAPGPPAVATPFLHDWKAPHATSPPVPPPFHNGHPRQSPLPLQFLKFNPLGIFELRRHLGLPADWDAYRRRFISGDIAWFASAVFFPEFDGLRNSVPQDGVGYNTRRVFSDQVRQLIFDLITMWDRTWGSTTMLLHVEGTTAPNTPPAPEYLRASVYLPPSFVRRNPDSHLPIAQMVQTFFESVGVPTVLNWTANAQLRHWPLTQHGPIPEPNKIAPDILIPNPQYAGSAHYVFRGRPSGFVFPATGSPTLPAGGDPPASQASTRYGSEEPEFSTDALALLSALERISQLEGEVTTTAAQVTEYMAEANRLWEVVQGAADEQERLYSVIKSLEEELARAHADLEAPRPSTPPRPPAYAASQLLTPARPRPSPSPSTPARILADHALPLTTAHLETAGATSHMAPIRMMVRFVPSMRWSEELRKFEMNDDVREGVLDSLTQDLEMNF
ncbi:hypothetical protein B0H11DRAFT_1917728 [Mycena galericulata]|nr:hypothetical protein B0H11DRAFT_1917728 [Mycena galericulata]